MRADDTRDVDEIAWLDDHDAPNRPDEDLPGADRPPPSRRRRLLIGALATVVLGGGAAAAVVAGDRGEDRSAASGRSASVPTPDASVPVPSVAIELPQRPLRSGVVAIRTAFPGADITGFVAAPSDDPTFGLRLAYNAKIGRRLLTVTVEPARAGHEDHVFRTASSFQLGVQRGPAYVDALLRVDHGTPTARDYARLQNLVLDNRLLATK